MLLTILPKLYDDLCSYPESLAKTNKCEIPYLQPYFLDPTVKKSSPYGVDVSKAISDFGDECDKDLMNVYLKKMCLTIAESLKRQRGNQYGFGDDPDSWDHVEKNLTEELLDDPDITTTKPIENFFGNLDRELRKTGSHGFDKAGDDLVIKYSKDLIQTDEFQWRTKANKQKAKELKSMQVAFNAQQKAQAALTANEEEAVLLNSQNRVLQCIQSCKEKHGGPITTKGELQSMVANWE